MDTILDYTEPFSQDNSSTGLDRFDQDYADKLVYNDVVVKSGVDPDICRLNFPPATTQDNRGLLGATFEAIGGVA
jgi:hypothetical protein